MKQNFEIIPYEQIENKIYLIRGQKVMLDRDLAVLYGVETKVLNQAVRRNLDRFPGDFMFILNEDETKVSRSQIVTLKKDEDKRGSNIKYLPIAFTEQGVAMLSGVLKSKRAVAVNIQIVRTFVKIREMIQENDYLRRRLEAMEKDYDERFAIVFEAIRRLLDEPVSEEVEIGFKI
jgi:hypothetical protein